MCVCTFLYLSKVVSYILYIYTRLFDWLRWLNNPRRRSFSFFLSVLERKLLIDTDFETYLVTPSLNSFWYLLTDEFGRIDDSVPPLYCLFEYVRTSVLTLIRFTKVTSVIFWFIIWLLDPPSSWYCFTNYVF